MPKHRNGPATLVRQAGPQKFSDFQDQKYFPNIDGLRAISIIAVISFHVSGPLWEHLNGYLGVTVFFVLSGFLITTLLLREEASRQRISIRNFYIRRIFRIFPLYYVALALYAILVVKFGLGSDPQNFEARFPLLALYLGEFAGTGTFSHSWSLGIEEKYYLIWPLIGFVLLKAPRPRMLLTAALAVSTTLLGFFPPATYLSIYTPLILGSLLAQLLHSEQTYQAVAKLTKTPYIAAAVIAILMVAATNQETGYSHNLFAFLTTAIIAQIAVRPTSFNPFLGNKFVRFIGTRAYGMYLFHPLFLRLAERVKVPSGWDIAADALRFAIVVLAALAFADIAYRVLERPLIRIGHSLSRALPPRNAPRSASSDASGATNTPSGELRAVRADSRGEC